MKTTIKFPKSDSFAFFVTINKISKALDNAFFTVKENPDEEPVLQKKLGAGISLSDSRLYKNQLSYKVQIDGADTANMEVGVRYFFDVKGTIGNAQKTFLWGELILSDTETGYLNPAMQGDTAAVAQVYTATFETGAQSEYVETEVDPVAMKKIGDMTKLNTTAKDTLVKAINEVNTGRKTDRNDLDKILDGTTAVPKATNANSAKSAKSAESATKAEKTDFTNSEWTTVAEPTATTAINLNNGTYEFLVYGNDMQYQFQGGISKVVTLSGAFVNDNGGGSIRLGSYAEKTGDVFESVHVDLILLESETGGYSVKVKMTKKASDTVNYYPPFKYRKIR